MENNTTRMILLIKEHERFSARTFAFCAFEHRMSCRKPSHLCNDYHHTTLPPRKRPWKTIWSIASHGTGGLKLKTTPLFPRNRSCRGATTFSDLLGLR